MYRMIWENSYKKPWKKELAKNNQLLKTSHLDKYREKMEVLYIIVTDYRKEIILLK